MFVLINEIGIDNLPDGDLRVRSISRDEAIELTKGHREEKRLVGAFDMGPVPDERKQAKFRQAIEVIQKIGLPMDEANFTTGFDGEEGQQLNMITPPRFCMLQEDRPILVLCFTYEMKPGERLFFTPLHEKATFRLFELNPSERPGAIAGPDSRVEAASRREG